LAAEAMNRPEYAEEDFLGEIKRLLAIAEQVDRQLDDHPLVLADEIGAGGFVAGCTPLHQRRFTSANVRPADARELFQREVPKRACHGPGNSFYYILLRLRSHPEVPLLPLERS
jgi:hypothetical protein